MIVPKKNFCNQKEKIIRFLWNIQSTTLHKKHKRKELNQGLLYFKHFNSLHITICKNKMLKIEVNQNLFRFTFIEWRHGCYRQAFIPNIKRKSQKLSQHQSQTSPISMKYSNYSPKFRMELFWNPCSKC
jgi:hypothetical protein